MFTNCILFATFCSMGTLVRRKKTWHYSARKGMEFGQLMRDILVYVSCKFEMYIIELAEVNGENVPIAFLHVLSICYGKTTGASCSKLTTSFVNVSFKLYLTTKIQIHSYFCWKNVRIFCCTTKINMNNPVCHNVVVIYLTG